MKLIQWIEDEKGEGEFKKEEGKKINRLINEILSLELVFLGLVLISSFSTKKI